MTGTVGEETAVELIKKGATDYILKDRLVRLPAAVRRALDERAAGEERRKVERIRDLLASIVESSDDAIIGIALDGTILSWNRGAEHIYGHTSTEVHGKLLANLFAPEHASEADNALAKLRRGEPVGRYESKGLRKGGEVIDVAVTMSLIRNAGGELIGTSAVIRDTTEQKRLEKNSWFRRKWKELGGWQPA